MADLQNLSKIENYIPTEWRNYIPPSIDQEHLNHLEENVKLNRDTINDIIERLGIKSSSSSTEDDDIYNSAIYDTLISFKDKIKNLEDSKVNQSAYDKKIAELETKINGKLSKITDDSGAYTYTFKKLILQQTSSSASALEVTGAASISGVLTVAGITSSAVITAQKGISTTTLSASGAVTVGNTLTVTKGITGNGGITITNGGTITGTLTVDNLRVTGAITCDGAINANSATITEKLIAKNVTAEANIKGKNVTATNNYITFGDARKLYVQASKPTLNGTDAAILTVS